MTHDRFFEVPRTVQVTSEGPVELPIFYRDVSNVIALFLVPRDRAARMLDGSGLVPGLTLGDRAVVALSFYEYRDTSVGVYNEVGTAIFALREGEPHPLRARADLLLPPAWRRGGAWVVDLPVTTAAANAAGREIWGYPKFVTGITFDLAERRFASTVLDPNGRDEIVTLAGTLGRGVPAPPLSLVTLSRLDGALVRTHVDVRGRQSARAAGSVRLRVGASAHRMAANLRALDLDGARPFVVMTTDRFQSKLHEGRVIDG